MPNWANLNSSDNASKQNFYNKLNSAMSSGNANGQSLSPDKFQAIWEGAGKNDSDAATQATQYLLNSVDPTHTQMSPVYRQWLLSNASRIRGQQMLEALAGGGQGMSGNPSEPGFRDFGSFLTNWMQDNSAGASGYGFLSPGTASSMWNGALGNLNKANQANGSAVPGWDAGGNQYVQQLLQDPAAMQLLYTTGLSMAHPWNYQNGLGQNIAQDFNLWMNPQVQGPGATWMNDFYNNYLKDWGM